MPQDDPRLEDFDPIQRQLIRDMIRTEVEKLGREVENRQHYPKHADLHGPGGRDPINATGANTPGGGWAGFWPVMNTATELTIASGVVTITQDHHILVPESGTEDTLSTINGYVNNKFLVLRVQSGNKVFINQSGNVECIDPVTGESGSPGNYILLQDTEDWALLWWQPDRSVWSCMGFVQEQWFARREESTLNQKTMRLSSTLQYNASGYTIDADGDVNITTNGNYVTLIPNTGTTDNLDGISVFNRADWAVDGAFFFLRTDDPTYTITLRHGQTPVGATAKGLNMPDGLNIVLDFYDQFVLAIYNATDAKWVCIPLSNPYFTGSGGFPTKIIDADGDTYVNTEVTADSDVIESASGGTIRSRLSALGLQLANGTDLLLYSDAFSTLKGTWDAATGHMVLGGSGTPSALQILAASETFTDPSGNVVGFTVTPSLGMTAGSTRTLTAFISNASVSGGFTASGIITGNQTTLTTATASTVVNDFRNFRATAVLAASTTLVDRYGLYVADPTGSGSLTNQYGVYIENMAKGGTINRAIQSLGGLSTHLGAIRFGSNTAPTNTTNGDITGTRLIVPDATLADSDLITFLGGPVGIANEGVLRLYGSSSTDYVGLKAPTTPQTEQYIYVLPDDDPSNGQVLAVKSTAASPTITTEWVAAGAGSGHTIQDDNSSMTARTNLSFQDGFVITDDAGGDQTEVDLSYATTTEIADVATSEGAGTSITVARGDHVHKAAYNGIATTGMTREITLLAMSGIPRVTSGALSAQLYDSGSNDITFMGIPFSPSSAQYVTWAFPLPGDYDGSTVTFKVYWTATDGTGDVEWSCRATSATDNEDINGTAMGTAVAVVDTKLTNNYLHASAESGALTIAGTPAADHYCFFELLRDPADAQDTFSGTPVLMSIKITYGVSGLST